VLEEVGAKLYRIVISKLNISVVRSALLLTNVKYVEVEGYNLYPIVWPFLSSGFVIPYNAIPVHSPSYSTPWIFVYDNSSMTGVYVEFSRTCLSNILAKTRAGALTVSEATSTIIKDCVSKLSVVKLNITHILRIGLREPSKTWKMLESQLDSATFSILTIVTVWSHGAPPELLVAAELHNHVCPGLLSGFLMYRYLLEHGLVKPRDKVYVIASPVYCKDDVYVQLLDATPGKRRIIVKLLPYSEQDKISKILGGNIAGIVITYDPLTDKGKAIILAFNWSKVHNFLKTYNVSFHGPSWWISRLLADLYLLKYVNKPEVFVKVLKIIRFKGHTGRYPTLFYNLGRAGVDPYKVLGILKPESKSQTENFITYVELAIIIVLAIALIVTVALFIRTRRRILDVR